MPGPRHASSSSRRPGRISVPGLTSAASAAVANPPDRMRKRANGRPSAAGRASTTTPAGCRTACRRSRTAACPCSQRSKGAASAAASTSPVPATMRYATEDAYFTIFEINIGITADVGTFPRLPKLIPEGIVRELAYTGRRMPAAEAKEVGLVNRVFPDQASMLDGVFAIAREIASKPPLAVYGCKRMINYARDHTTADGLDYIAIWNASFLQPARCRSRCSPTASNGRRVRGSAPEVGVKRWADVHERFCRLRPPFRPWSKFDCGRGRPRTDELVNAHFACQRGGRFSANARGPSNASAERCRRRSHS